MFRHISIDLQGWLLRKDRRPLLLRGARQVGKTRLARALAREQGLDLVEVLGRGKTQQPGGSGLPHRVRLQGLANRN